MPGTMLPDPHELLVEMARRSLDRQLAAGTAEQADARIAKLRAWGMQARAENVLAARIRVFGPVGAATPVFRWYRCHDCGWEHEYVAMRQQCGNVSCPSVYGLHVHSSVDGERPTTLPKHRTSCSDQNAIHPFGAWIGARECRCNTT